MTIGAISTAIMLVSASVPAVAFAQGDVWIRQFGTNTHDRANDVVSDGTGGAFIAGSTGGILAPGGGGEDDGWLARYDQFGSRIWIRQFGSTEGDHAEALIPDGEGGVFVAGSTAWLFGDTFFGDIDAWIARFDGDGEMLWVRQFGTELDERVYGLALDESGHVFVGGHTEGDLAGTNAGELDVFLARYDGTGNQIWIRQFGSSDVDQTAALSTDGTGGVFMAGETQGNLGGALNGYNDGWLAHFDGSGNRNWIRQIGSAGMDQASALASNGDTSVYIAGWTDGDLGGANLGREDAWLARYDQAGNQLWMRQLGTFHVDVARALALDADGNVVVTGETQASFVGVGTGSSDVWLGWHDTSGNLLGMRQFGSPGQDWVWDIDCDGAGGLFLAGETRVDFGGHRAGGFSDAWVARGTPAIVSDFSIAFGTLLSGTRADLLASDDRPVQARSQFGFAANEPNLLDVRVGAPAPLESPASIDLAFEGRLNQSGGIARIRLRNWNTDLFEQVHQYPLSMLDSVEEILGIDATNRVRSGDLRIEISMRQSALTVFSVSGFQSFTDWVGIAVHQ